MNESSSYVVCLNAKGLKMAQVLISRDLKLSSLLKNKT